MVPGLAVGPSLDLDLLQLVREGGAVQSLSATAWACHPRPPAEILGGDGFDVLAGTARVVTSDGQDVTLAYLKD